MDNPRGSGGSADRDNVEAQSDSPQRPQGPQPSPARPRLDPPAANDPRSYRAAQAPPPRAPQVRSQAVRMDDTKETQVLPIVEPSRFERAGQQRPQDRPQPQSQPSRHSASEMTDRIPLVRRRPADEPQQDPQATREVRRPDNRPPQYERGYGDEGASGATGYDPSLYREPQRVSMPVPPQKGKEARKGGPDHSRSYLSVAVDSGRRRRVGWLLWPLLGVLALALIGSVALALSWQGQYAGKVYAGVSALDTDLGGMTPEDAKKTLRDKVQAFVAQPVVLTWRGKEWRPSGEQLGIKVDVDSTVDEAYRVGRGSDPLSGVSQQWYSAQSGYRVPIVVQINEPAMQTYLKSIAQSEIDQELFEGDVRLNGTEIVALPGKEGRELRLYDAIKAVREQAAKLEQGQIELPVETTQPSVSAEEVGYIQGLLSVRISGPITATAPGKVFTLDRDAIVRFTTIERNPDRSAARHIELAWKDNELKILAERWAREASRAARNARFAWNGGAVSVLGESEEGFEIDASTVISSIMEHAGTTDKREYALPGKVLAPAVSSKDIGALGIRELMGAGVSTFRGSSPERVTNIRVAAQLLNGVVVPPGGTFSFLEAMGGIDEAHGFVEGYVIAAERTQLGVGGGVCQVSTTAFRAFFWSGVNITERNQHSYRVGWYEANGEPVGFDAAVFDPGVDLKFVNNSPGYVLVEALVSSDTLTVSVYGTKIAGEVKLEGPAIANRVPPPPDVYQVDPRLPPGTRKQVETARGGLDTTITRRIVVPGQPDKVDQFYSSYKAWPNWYIVASPSQVPGGVTPVP